jgi:hypothetical protein
MLKRVVDHADGWLPNRIAPSDLEKARRELDRRVAEAGRDAKAITISVYGQEPRKDLACSLLDAGADRVVVRATHVETEAEWARSSSAWPQPFSDPDVVPADEDVAMQCRKESASMLQHDRAACAR